MVKLSMMGSSKYEFDGDLDSDIQNRIEKNKEIQKEFYVDVLNIFKKYGREKAEKLLTDFVVSLKKGELEIMNGQVSKVDKGQIIW
ncbi:hypothetical protein QK099_001150 [Enterococcus faecalis]|uniref:hypothetical protein n=1 Tax=Enterococcus faecalis TaxID=1351 RepID=UPI000353D8F5|nr:hypothetical protein [Enterococcus faecalis]EGO7788311.1 hypothetical protein [Enterococcus faecalis]EGO8055120.1 hypothetical protein [Enterococcus faecalis]EHZ5087823.1 hypothetical protein [Enterococcus faecalis]EIT1921364.1 hypothetical protein [Enterococcus faecalis]EIX0240049.1 hypothetical protein [Enterococcus faecalis]